MSLVSSEQRRRPDRTRAMAGRAAWLYLLPGVLAALLVAWWLYARGAAPGAAGGAAAPSEGASAPARRQSEAGSDASSAPPAAPSDAESERDAAGASDAVARSARRHVVVAPSAAPIARAATGLEGFGVIDDMTEAPGAPASDAVRPCVVYFTDNIKTCDNGEYDYPVFYYQEKMRKVQAAVRARGGTPTPAQNDLILKYSRILADYEKIPQKQYCKLPMPNWVQLTADKQPPILSRGERNKDRGPVEHWAFCWRDSRTTTPAGLAKTGMIVDMAGGKPTGMSLGDAFYYRGKFDETISPSGALKTFCHETDGKVSEYQLRTALVLQNVAKGPLATTFYLNGRASGVSESEADTYFREHMFSETVQRPSGDREVVTAEPVARSVRLVKLVRDPCGRSIEHYATIAKAKFRDAIPLASTPVGAGDDFLLGRSYDLTARIASHEAEIAGRTKDLAARDKELAGRWAELAKAYRGYVISAAVRLFAMARYLTCMREKRQAAPTLRAPTADPLNPKPARDETVSLYYDANYQRLARRVGVGNYSWVGSYGISNDAISSLIVGADVVLIVYEDTRYGGAWREFVGPAYVPMLTDVRKPMFWDNKISSFKVVRKG